MNWTNMAARVWSSNGASFWLKDQLRALCKRDPVDAWKDAQALADIMRKRVDEVIEEAEKEGIL